MGRFKTDHRLVLRILKKNQADSSTEDNRLEDLKRVPSDLRRYIAWSHGTRKRYGSIQAFVLKERLGWTDLKCKNQTPYAEPGS